MRVCFSVHSYEGEATVDVSARSQARHDQLTFENVRRMRASSIAKSETFKRVHASQPKLC